MNVGKKVYHDLYPEEGFGKIVALPTRGFFCGWVQVLWDDGRTFMTPKRFVKTMQ
jgi:hypothetical protein